MLVEESDDIQHSVYASSQGKETYFASNLQSNTKYSCHVTTIAEKVKSPPTPEVTFSTAYGSKYIDMTIIIMYNILFQYLYLLHNLLSKFMIIPALQSAFITLLSNLGL